MANRKDFIKYSALAAALIATKKSFGGLSENPGKESNMFLHDDEKPIVMSTWSHGIPANNAAWKIIAGGGKSLDAVEAGVRVTEGDPKVTSVGYGGMPDRDGHVTLDACIMDEDANCGAVCFLEDIMHPISVARLVMEKTPHIMLAGSGAQQFALENGFKKENLLTPESEAAWKEWLKKSKYQPKITPENHDTIGMLAMDRKGNLSGACTTSGLQYKIRGRVGDSPIIGAALFVDSDVGAAAATGVGEEVIRMCGSHTVVELMRNGNTPQVACAIAIGRIKKNLERRRKKVSDYQIAFIALNKHGEYGACSLTKGFEYAVFSEQIPNKLFTAKSLS